MLAFVFKHPVFIAFGVGLIVLGFYVAWRKHHLLLTGHLAEGRVIALVPHSGSKGGVTYSSRVTYTQPDGTLGEFETSFSSSPPLHEMGEKVRVVYYPGKEKPDILAFADLFLFSWACICAGIFILMMCAGFIYGPRLMDSLYLPFLGNPNPLKIVEM
jgi:hypothetical protein